MTAPRSIGAPRKRSFSAWYFIAAIVLMTVVFAVHRHGTARKADSVTASNRINLNEAAAANSNIGPASGGGH